MEPRLPQSHRNADSLRPSGDCPEVEQAAVISTMDGGRVDPAGWAEAGRITTMNMHHRLRGSDLLPIDNQSGGRQLGDGAFQRHAMRPSLGQTTYAAVVTPDSSSAAPKLRLGRNRTPAETGPALGNIAGSRHEVGSPSAPTGTPSQTNYFVMVSNCWRGSAVGSAFSAEGEIRSGGIGRHRAIENPADRHGHAGLMSVWAKSLPLNSSGSPVAFASA